MQKINIKIADYLIVGLLLAAGLAGFWFNLQQSGSSGPRSVLIFINNSQVAEVSLAEDYIYTFPFGPEGEHLAVLEIEDGRVRMLPMSKELCPKGICSHTGWISHPYEIIVCLPNRIMVIFADSSSGKNDGPDLITY